MSFEIRKETFNDLININNVIKSSFGREDESKLVDLLRQTNCITLSLIACIDGQIVGHIAFSPVFIRGTLNHFQSVGLAPLAVIPEYQRQGIGSNLINEGLKELKKMNIKAVFVLGDHSFYSRFGFIPAFSKFGIKSKYKVEDKYFMALELFDHSLNNVSGDLTYCQAFDSLNL